MYKPATPIMVVILLFLRPDTILLWLTSHSPLAHLLRLERERERGGGRENGEGEREGGGRREEREREREREREGERERENCIFLIIHATFIPSGGRRSWKLLSSPAQLVPDILGVQWK